MFQSFRERGANAVTEGFNSFAWMAAAHTDNDRPEDRIGSQPRPARATAKKASISSVRGYFLQ
jgi:hypothetical protein